MNTLEKRLAELQEYCDKEKRIGKIRYGLEACAEEIKHHERLREEAKSEEIRLGCVTEYTAFSYGWHDNAVNEYLAMQNEFLKLLRIEEES